MPELTSVGYAVSVLSRTTASAPGTPTIGMRYIVPAGATGIWNGRTDQIAHYLTAGWTYYTPARGATTLVQDEDVNVQFDGLQWRALTTEARRPSYIADEALSALRVVRAASPGHVVYARHPEQESLAPVGITVTSALSGARVTVATTGEISDGTWSWTPGLPVLLGANGTLTQTAPGPGSYIVQVAQALTATTIAVRIYPPIFTAS